MDMTGGLIRRGRNLAALCCAGMAANCTAETRFHDSLRDTKIGVLGHLQAVKRTVQIVGRSLIPHSRLARAETDGL